MRQLGRFLRLERVRKDNAHPTPALASRFVTLEAPETDSPPPPASRPSGGLERFSPEPEPPLTLELPDAAQPFVRCVRCGADSGRHATVCGHCEARLDTDEGRAFNARLWAEVTAAREREAARVSSAAPAQSEAALAAELAARLQAELELQRLSEGRTPEWFRTGRMASGAGPVLLLSLVLGIPGLLLVLSHRGALGAVLLLGLGALLLVTARRAP